MEWAGWSGDEVVWSGQGGVGGVEWAGWSGWGGVGRVEWVGWSGQGGVQLSDVGYVKARGDVQGRLVKLASPL